MVIKKASVCYIGALCFLLASMVYADENAQKDSGISDSTTEHQAASGKNPKPDSSGILVSSPATAAQDADSGSSSQRSDSVKNPKPDSSGVLVSSPATVDSAKNNPHHPDGVLVSGPAAADSDNTSAKDKN